MTKPEVREKARSLGLAVADQPDSQDLCFLGDGDYRDFLTRHAEQANTVGDIVDTDGNVIGKHTGLADYTIGQRKGLRIASETPLYVIEKVAETQKIVVGPFSALGKKRLVADRANWISGNIPNQAFSGEIKIRYKAKEAPGIVTPLEDGRSFIVDFEEELRDITPGQAAVIYNKEEVIGSGIIQK
jgi:tRNA-specific 2-thiouridylase